MNGHTYIIPKFNSPDTGMALEFDPVNKVLKAYDIDGNLFTIFSSSSIPSVFRAILTQSGTSNPTVTILGENTIGAISITRVGTGLYDVTSSSLFTANRTRLFDIIGVDSNIGSAYVSWKSSSLITIETFDTNGQPSDGILNSNLFEINVF